tara:strand:- start:179 stop:499 length:321 start_codon:yes stop_codon:yes gene_type:complete
MKITKTRLKQVIKEELSDVLDEQSDAPEYITMVQFRNYAGHVRNKLRLIFDHFADREKSIQANIAILEGKVEELQKKAGIPIYTERDRFGIKRVLAPNEPNDDGKK